MTTNAILQLFVLLLITLLLAKPLGSYLANVYSGPKGLMAKILSPLESILYRTAKVDCAEMSWKQYLVALLVFNFLGIIFVFLIQIFQVYLPLNPNHMANINFALALNTAISFVSNTNWQNYSGESMSYLTQMLAFTVQNFLSAATGICVLLVLIRGLSRQETKNLGNFWVDMTRSVLYVLLPLAVVFSVLLLSQGVIQNFHPTQTAQLMQPLTANHVTIAQQMIPQGPVASQEAIKELGTNGGGFFNANSAHPYENPTAFSNFLEMLAMLLIPAALCFAFGSMVKDKRQGLALILAMLIMFIPLALITIHAEQVGNPIFNQLGLHTKSDYLSTGGNMEGKEVRFGISDSSIFATVTTATSTGAVNAAMDSLTPIGGLVSMLQMQLGELIFGGVGTGLFSMILMVIIAVFIAGLMVGRTPEYLGKKVEPAEMKLASIFLLIVPAMILVGIAFSVLAQVGVSAIGNPGAHGFSEILYAFSSMANNNGSAFAGISSNTNFYNYLGGLIMLIGRFGLIAIILSLASSFASKKIIPPTPGTLPTHTPFFIGFLVVVILIMGALTFFPALALGPIVEQIMMLGH